MMSFIGPPVYLGEILRRPFEHKCSSSHHIDPEVALVIAGSTFYSCFGWVSSSIFCFEVLGLIHNNRVCLWVYFLQFSGVCKYILFQLTLFRFGQVKKMVSQVFLSFSCIVMLIFGVVCVSQTVADGQSPEDNVISPIQTQEVDVAVYSGLDFPLQVVNFNILHDVAGWECFYSCDGPGSQLVQ